MTSQALFALFVLGIPKFFLIDRLTPPRKGTSKSVKGELLIMALTYLALIAFTIWDLTAWDQISVIGQKKSTLALAATSIALIGLGVNFVLAVASFMLKKARQPGFFKILLTDYCFSLILIVVVALGT